MRLLVKDFKWLQKESGEQPTIIITFSSLAILNRHGNNAIELYRSEEHVWTTSAGS